MTTRYDRAVSFAFAAHLGAVDKKGRPYILHPLAVAGRLAAEGASEDEVIAGLLHDVLEDTPVTRDEIALRFGANVAHIVSCVSREEPDTYFEFIIGIAERAVLGFRSPLVVKLADLRCNHEDGPPSDKLRARYVTAIYYLEGIE